MPPLIINADDYGLTNGVCRAITELLDLGAVTSTTAMMAAPGSLTRITRYGTTDLAGRTGLHLALTGGSSLASHRSAPSLVDSFGQFRPRDQLHLVNSDDVLTEWSLQLDVFADTFGSFPTHLDSHHFVDHLAPARQAYLSLAAQYSLPVRGPLADSAVRATELVIDDWTCTHAGPAGLVSAVHTAESNLAKSTPTGVIEVVTHPGYCDSSLVAASSFNTAREEDYTDLVTLSRTGFWAENGFDLTDFTSLSHSVV